MVKFSRGFSDIYKWVSVEAQIPLDDLDRVMRRIVFEVREEGVTKRDGVGTRSV